MRSRGGPVRCEADPSQMGGGPACPEAGKKGGVRMRSRGGPFLGEEFLALLVEERLVLRHTRLRLAHLRKVAELTLTESGRVDFGGKWQS